jgi:hypothetical protein
MGEKRWRFWLTLTVLALLWMFGGPILTVAQYLSHAPRIDSSASVIYGVVDFLWTGLLATGVCAFFCYRNSPYWRKQKQHRALHLAQERTSAMQGGLAIARMQQAGQRATADSVALPSGLATKLETARGLMKEKKYDEARAILKTIDHPKATKWLEQIDQFRSWLHAAPESEDEYSTTRS